MSEVTELLNQARAGDTNAWDRVVGLIYDDLKRIARGVIGANASATLNPTALVHDCYLRLSKQGADGVLNRDHFLALAARAMRQLLLNHARDKLAQKRGAGVTLLELDPDQASVVSEAEQVIAIDSALIQLSIEDERLVSVVECRIFAGLSESETAAALGMPLRSAQRLWAQARARLEVLMTQ